MITVQHILLAARRACAKTIWSPVGNVVSDSVVRGSCLGCSAKTWTRHVKTLGELILRRDPPCHPRRRKRYKSDTPPDIAAHYDLLRMPIDICAGRGDGIISKVNKQCKIPSKTKSPVGTAWRELVRI